jgi:hypothetical protein
VVEVRWTMTATHAELLRSLPSELAASAERHGGSIRGRDGDRHWALELQPEARRRIGLLDLPVTEVTIRLAGYSDEERVRFLERLEQCYRRAGG